MDRKFKDEIEKQLSATTVSPRIHELASGLCLFEAGNKLIAHAVAALHEHGAEETAARLVIVAQANCELVDTMANRLCQAYDADPESIRREMARMQAIVQAAGDDASEPVATEREQADALTEAAAAIVKARGNGPTLH